MRLVQLTPAPVSICARIASGSNGMSGRWCDLDGSYEGLSWSKAGSGSRLTAMSVGTDVELLTELISMLLTETGYSDTDVDRRLPGTWTADKEVELGVTEVSVDAVEGQGCCIRWDCNRPNENPELCHHLCRVDFHLWVCGIDW